MDADLKRVLSQTGTKQGAKVLSALTKRELTDVVRLMSGNLGSSSWGQPSAATKMMDIGVSQASKL